jgi:CelD/BcsL family acetyltransferase involved in cellulose biosynthesis
MQVTRYMQLADCWDMAVAWDCMAHGSPFRRTAWLLSWWNHYRSLGELYVLCVTDEQGQVVGIAPWYIEHSLRWGRTVRPLGSGNTCSDYLGILTTPEHGPQVTAALSHWLLEAAGGKLGPEHRWDLLDLVSVDAEDETMIRFVEQLQSDDVHIHRREAMSCWSVPLPGTWEEYLATLGQSHRKRLRRADRTWLASGATRLRTVEAQPQLGQAMDALVRLHQQRQQSLGRPGCFADAAFAAFLQESAERLLSEQLLRLHWLERGGDAIAAEFQLAGGERTYAYLGGMNAELDDCSPGMLIQMAILQGCIAEGQREYDFLRGDESYKFHWGVRQRRCVDYRAVSPHHAAQLRHQVWLAGGAMKQWIRSGLQLAGLSESSVHATGTH